MSASAPRFDIVDLLMQDATRLQAVADAGQSPIGRKTAQQLHELIRIDISGSGWKDEETPGSQESLEMHLREISQTLDLVQQEIAKRDRKLRLSRRPEHLAA